MESEQRQIIDRIRKLLALSSSSNEAEAALAAARAQELLQKHNLSLGVIEDSSQQRAEQMGTELLGTRVQPHVWELARACNQMFDVRFFGIRKWADSASWRWQWNKQIMFIGLRANVEAAIVTHPYLCAAVTALARQRAQEGAIRGASEARDYKLGAAQRILEEIGVHKRRMTAADPSVAALVRVGSDIAQRALNALNLGRARGYKESVSDGDAYELGRSDGGKINPYAARTSRMLGEGRS